MLEARNFSHGIVLYVSPLLSAWGVPHAFSTRRSGVSPPPFDSLNLGIASQGPGSADGAAPAGAPGAAPPRDSVENVRANYALVLQALGCPERRLAWVDQVHGGAAHAVTPETLGEHPQADALLTGDPGAMLSVRVADCVPILLAIGPRDAGRPTFVAAVHAGWRGVVAGVVPRAMGLLRERFGTGDSRAVAAVGPCISRRHFEVGPEVAEAFREKALGDAVEQRAGAKPHIDLAGAVMLQLLDTGMDRADIDATDRCTFRDADEFFSHRRDAGRTGRMAALIGLPP
ncbi:MAG: peptidoglycan editing factor PgeF [Planctomycetota bacterium]|nr:peptidoglycan editing factor PgeF [Planctomycetota bacterium]